MERPIVKQYDFELIWIFFWELVQEELEGSAVAKRHFHFKMLSCYGRKCPEQIAGFKNLLKDTNGLDTFQGKSLSISSKNLFDNFAEPYPSSKTYTFALQVAASVNALAISNLVESFSKI